MFRLQLNEDFEQCQTHSENKFGPLHEVFSDGYRTLASPSLFPYQPPLCCQLSSTGTSSPTLASLAYSGTKSFQFCYLLSCIPSLSSYRPSHNLSFVTSYLHQWAQPRSKGPMEAQEGSSDNSSKSWVQCENSPK